MTQWNAEQYLKFEKQRTRPAIDLSARIPIAHPKKIVDIGCGPGNSTAVLQQRFPEAEILGVDASDEMVRAAREAHPDLHFEKCDAQIDLPTIGTDYDVVFSNACLQWIPDHPAMVRHMLDVLHPGGILAVQIPITGDEPIHKILMKLVQSPQWKQSFLRPRAMYCLTPSSYYDLLSETTQDFHIWQTTYFHHMPNHEAIVEWYRGTGLRPYLNALHPDRRERFVEDVRKEVRRAYHAQKDGTVIFRYPRLFFVATK